MYRVKVHYTMCDSQCVLMCTCEVQRCLQCCPLVRVPPHGGGPLKPLLVGDAERAEVAARAESLPRVTLSSRELSDLFMLGMGAYTPLDGFMREADWRGTCVDMKLANGMFWPIPITLSCGQGQAAEIAIGDEIALTNESGALVGAMRIGEKYTIDRVLECQKVYGTTDDKHPGVQKVLEQGGVNLAGPVSVLSEGHYPKTYKGLYYRPAET